MTPLWDLAISWALAVVAVTASLVRVARRGRAGRAVGHGGAAAARPALAVWTVHGAWVTPNQVSLFSLLPGLAAGIAVACGFFGLATLVATVAAFCGGVDGLIARERRTASDGGEAMDAAVDRYLEFFFQAGLCFHYRQQTGPLLLALGALLASFMVSYATAKAESLHIAAPGGTMRRAQRAVYLFVGAGLTPLWDVYVAGEQGALGWRELPILVALGVMALVGNLSVLQRTRVMMHRLRSRDASG